MSDRVGKFPIEGIQHLFTPCGLPLTEKGEDVPPATSVLVRGGAGVGKTTLALGLAHGIAQHLNGPVLYVATEFVPSEVKFKAQVLGIEEVLSWDRRSRASAGSVVVHHLAAEADVSGQGSSSSIKRQAIDVAWQMIEESGSQFRALVIDAFISPETGEVDPGLRSSVLTLIQALEARGVSPVLVQEEVESLDWLAFVVDVVVGLAFVEERVSGELHRKLTLAKCRYSLSLAGPHDYGLDNEKPAVWPNLLAVILGDPKAVPPVEPAGIVLPSSQSHIVVMERGGLILSDYAAEPIHAIDRILDRVPGARRLEVSCGPVTHVTSEGVGVSVPDWEGPFSVGWAAARAMRDAQTNVVFITRLESLLERPRFAIGILHTIEALVACGALVCVHGDGGRLVEAFGPRFAYANRGPRLRGRELRPSPMRSALRWAPNPLCHAPSSDPSAGVTELHDALRLVDFDQPTASLARLNALPDIAPGHAEAVLNLSLTLDRLGDRAAARRRVVAVDTSQLPPSAVVDVIFTSILLGDDALAVRRTYDAIVADKADSRILLIFKALCARHARNRVAASELADEQRDQQLALSLLTLTNVLPRDATIDELAAAGGWPEWLAVRAKAESRMNASNPKTAELGAQRLRELLEQSTALPTIQRAEILANLGHRSLAEGKDETGRDLLNQARGLNPGIDLMMG